MQTLDAVVCDAAALQNKRSAWMQSIRDGSMLTDQGHYDTKTFLNVNNVKTGTSRARVKSVRGLICYIVPEC